MNTISNTFAHHRGTGRAWRSIVAGCILLTALVELAFLLFGMPDVGRATGPMFLYHRLAGSYILTVVSTGILFMACFTAMSTFEQVRQKLHTAAPVFGVAVCWGAAIDVCYFFLADSLIDNMVDSGAKANVIAFVWAICRATSGLILVAGAAVLLLHDDTRIKDLSLINIIGPALFLVGIVVAYFGATTSLVMDYAPTTGQLQRPWDLLPLAVYTVGGAWVFPAVYRRGRTQFVLALWVATLPAIFAHAHMAFGSTAIFDRNFYLAHVLIFVAYMTRLGGLLLDHSRAYTEIRQMNNDLRDRLKHQRAG
ncbi:MAG: hypothetical protein GC159_00415 [Phycisphaera sp.]|nr:hypothetical protein [Phycisphaera sp.]